MLSGSSCSINLLGTIVWLLFCDLNMSTFSIRAKTSCAYKWQYNTNSIWWILIVAYSQDHWSYHHRKIVRWNQKTKSASDWLAMLYVLYATVPVICNSSSPNMSTNPLGSINSISIRFVRWTSPLSFRNTVYLDVVTALHLIDFESAFLGCCKQYSIDLLLICIKIIHLPFYFRMKYQIHYVSVLIFLTHLFSHPY